MRRVACVMTLMPGAAAIEFSEAAIKRLNSPLARRLELHGEIGSTQERARELALSGAPHGTLVISRVQTGGRGRRGRNWGSPPGGLWMSLVLRLELEAEHAHRTTQAAAVGVAKALRSIEVPASIKWPNDLLVGGRKICGILAACPPPATIPGGKPHAPGCVVLGVGLNANLDPRDLGLPNKVATIRSVLGRDVDETRLLETILSHLDYELRRIEHFESILTDWRELDCTLGKKVRVQSSGCVLEGLALDLSTEGALLLQTATGIVELFEGDVEHLRL